MLAMWVPELPFQLAAQRDAGLRARPLAFLSPLPGRVPTLWLVNRAAKAEGLRAGDPLDAALRQVAGLRVLDPQPQTWWEAQGAYQQTLERWSPQGRLVRLGEALVELKGTERLFGPPQDAARRLRTELHDAYGWQSQAGLSRSATAATLASRDETDLQVVSDGAESAFLAPRPLRALPDLAPQLLQRLRRLGLRTLGDLQPVPLKTLSELTPERAAQDLLQKVRGEDRPKLPLFAEAPGSSRHLWRLEPPCLPEEAPLGAWLLHRLWSDPRSPRQLSLRWWDVDGTPHFWRLEANALQRPPLILARELEEGFRQRATRRALVHRVEARLRWGLGQAQPLFTEALLASAVPAGPRPVALRSCSGLEEPSIEKLQRVEHTLARLRHRYPGQPVRPGWLVAEEGEGYGTRS